MKNLQMLNASFKVQALLSLTYSRDESSLDIFKDAEKIEAECADAVLRMFNLGLMPDDSGVINPESAITRAELAQMIYIALNGGVDDGAVAYADEDIFSDVKADDWYAGYANYCASQDVVPITADYFNATNPVTTADAARMLLCAMGYSAETCGFVGDNWSNNVLAASEAVGLLDGFNYSTNTYIPRQWLAVIFCNAIDNA